MAVDYFICKWPLFRSSMFFIRGVMVIHLCAAENALKLHVIGTCVMIWETANGKYSQMHVCMYVCVLYVYQPPDPLNSLRSQQELQPGLPAGFRKYQGFNGF